MTSTYVLSLSVETGFSGGDHLEEVPLIDYGYTDEEWDELTEARQGHLLDDWGQDFMVNCGVGYGARVGK